MTLGRPDDRVTRDETLGHARAIVDAVEVPVSADLENGFGPRPEDAAETIRLAGEAGLAGGSIEDASALEARPLLSDGRFDGLQADRDTMRAVAQPLR